MDIAELDVNAVCFGILCNFPQFCGEERAKEAAELVRALYAERKALRTDLARVTAERDAAIKELENHMVQDVVDGNEPCGICAKASNIPCECCDPKWRGIKED